MRYLLCFITLLLLNTQNSFAQEKMFYGGWEVTTVDGEEAPDRDAGLRLTFMKKGIFELIDQGRTIKGTWTLSADYKTIAVELLDEGEAELGNLKVVEVTKKTMKLDNRGSTATFKKLGKAPKSKKPKKVKSAANKK